MSNSSEIDDWHRAEWMQTFTGRKFRPLAPRVADIDIIDIAHSLSMQCRYNGHVREFYSVGQHCVLISQHVPEHEALWGLLHDATEAYVGDMIRPLKINMPAFKAAENAIMDTLIEAFNLASAMPESVHEADSRILLDERNALLGAPPDDWQADATTEPLGIEIEPWSPAEAKQRYLERFLQLYSGKPPA